MYLIQCMKWIIRGIYALLKLLPTQKNKVVFLSRQFNRPSLDFHLLKIALEQEKPEIKITMITKRLDKSLRDIAIFSLYSLLSLYHLATAEVCILDSYWPMVSIVHHKKELTVIQMWHAMGKIKKSGYQTLGKPYGHREKVARLMCMHQGYDVIIAGGRTFNPFYCQAFQVEENKLLNIGLPRMDYLMANQMANQARLFETYPEFREKKIILYAPTFRKGVPLNCGQLIASLPSEKYILVVKPHQNQCLKQEDLGRVYTCDDFSTMAVLSGCDYVITDYSAIAMEAAVLRKKTFYYVFDYDEYIERNGLNIDLFHEMPGCVFRDAKALVCAMESGVYNHRALDAYCRRYLPDQLGQATRRLTRLVLDCLERGKDEGIRQSFIGESEVVVSLAYQNTAG